MSDESIFESSATQDQVGAASGQQDDKAAEASQENPYADLLKGITTEDGRPKYNSLEDAINSIPHSQKHISTLEQELKQLREEREALVREQENRKKVEDTMNAVNAPKGEQSAKPELDKEELVSMIDQVLGQHKQQETAQNNVKAVVSALTEKFGDQDAAEKAYVTKAQELGIDVDILNNLAKSSPAAVLAYFGTSAPTGAPSKTTGSLNTAGLNSSLKQSQRGKNPLLSGNMSDMQAEWNRIKQEIGVT